MKRNRRDFGFSSREKLRKVTLFINISSLINSLPLQAEDDGHEDGRAEHDVGEGIDEVGVEERVEHGVELEGPREGVVGHEEDAEDRVDRRQHHDQGVEAVPHLLSVRERIKKGNVLENNFESKSQVCKLPWL